MLIAKKLPGWLVRSNANPPASSYHLPLLAKGPGILALGLGPILPSRILLVQREIGRDRIPLKWRSKTIRVFQLRDSKFSPKSSYLRRKSHRR